MIVTETPRDPAAESQQMGGELGATLFCAGLRIWIPEAATAADIEAAIRGLQCFADVARSSHSDLLD